MWLGATEGTKHLDTTTGLAEEQWFRAWEHMPYLNEICRLPEIKNRK